MIGEEKNVCKITGIRQKVPIEKKEKKDALNIDNKTKGERREVKSMSQT